MMNSVQTFLVEIEGFLARSKMTPTAFGRSAVKDPNFVSDIRRGRVPNLALVDRVRAFIQFEEAKKAARQEEPAA